MTLELVAKRPDFPPYSNVDQTINHVVSNNQWEDRPDRSIVVDWCIHFGVAAYNEKQRELGIEKPKFPSVRAVADEMIAVGFPPHVYRDMLSHFHRQQYNLLKLECFYNIKAGWRYRLGENIAASAQTLRNQWKVFNNQPSQPRVGREFESPFSGDITSPQYQKALDILNEFSIEFSKEIRIYEFSDTTEILKRIIPAISTVIRTAGVALEDIENPDERLEAERNHLKFAFGWLDPQGKISVLLDDQTIQIMHTHPPVFIFDYEVILPVSADHTKWFPGQIYSSEWLMRKGQKSIRNYYPLNFLQNLSVQGHFLKILKKAVDDLYRILPKPTAKSPEDDLLA